MSPDKKGLLMKIEYTTYTQTGRCIKTSGEIISRDSGLITYRKKDGEIEKVNISSPHVKNIIIKRG
jgi:hypothetical protein